MQDAQDLQFPAAHPIGNDVRRSRDHHLPGAWYAAGSSHGRMPGEPRDGLKQPGACTVCRVRVVFPDVAPQRREVIYRASQPDYFQGGGRSDSEPQERSQAATSSCSTKGPPESASFTA